MWYKNRATVHLYDSLFVYRCIVGYCKRTNRVQNRTFISVCVLFAVFWKKVRFVRYSCTICTNFVRLQIFVFQ